MRTRIIIAVISLAIGLFAGAKIMEHLGREYIVNNFPIPSGTLDDKDAYIKKIDIGLEVPEKKLKKVKEKAKKHHPLHWRRHEHESDYRIEIESRRP